jgi:hypothetical protein
MTGGPHLSVSAGAGGRRAAGGVGPAACWAALGGLASAAGGLRGAGPRRERAAAVAAGLLLGWARKGKGLREIGFGILGKGFKPKRIQI